MSIGVGSPALFSGVSVWGFLRNTTAGTNIPGFTGNIYVLPGYVLDGYVQRD